MSERGLPQVGCGQELALSLAATLCGRRIVRPRQKPHICLPVCFRSVPRAASVPKRVYDGGMHPGGCARCCADLSRGTDIFASRNTSVQLVASSCL